MQQCLFALMVVGWLWSAVPYSFAEGNFQRDTLRGLPGVWVVVEQLPSALERTGLTQGHVHQEAEDKLRKAGVKILTQEECWQTPGMPWLYLTIALFKANETTYAVTIAATLNQEVTLTRNPQIKTFGVTWDAGVQVGAVDTESLPTIRQKVGGLVDKFVADYQAMNP